MHPPQPDEMNFMRTFGLTYFEPGETRVLKMFTTSISVDDDMTRDYYLICLVDDTVNKRFKLVQFAILERGFERLSELFLTRYDVGSGAVMPVSLTQMKSDSTVLNAVFKDLDGWIMIRVRVHPNSMKHLELKSLAVPQVRFQPVASVLWTCDDENLYGVEGNGINTALRAFKSMSHMCVMYCCCCCCCFFCRCRYVCMSV